MDEEALAVDCAHCGVTFASAMQLDPATFEKVRARNMLEVCSA
jgi:hypothetical protein